MKNIAIIILVVLSSVVSAQKGAITVTHYPNGDVVENAAAKTDTIQLCGNWTAVGRMENGLKEGWWEISNGKSLNYSGTYRKGKKQGEWKSTHPAAKLNYKDDLLDGEILYYHTNSIAIEERRHYVAGKAHGDWIVYDEDGVTPTITMHYKNDFPTGTWEIHSGEVMYKGPTNEFGFHGAWTASVNDTIVGGGNYVNGKQEGQWTDVLSRYEKSTGRFINGQREGLWRSYLNGHLQTSREFVHDKRHGADTSWNAGHITYIAHWYEDKADGTHTNFYSNGSKESEYVYSHVTRSATFRSFDENEKLLITGQLEINPDYLILEADREKHCGAAVYDEYKLALLEMGICYWYCTGSTYGKPDVDFDSVVRYLRSEQFRKDTLGPHRAWNTPMYMRTGVWTEYYPGKKKKEEGMYEARVEIDPLTSDPIYFKTGWWNVYEESGVLLRQELYENGKRIETRNRKK